MGYYTDYEVICEDEEVLEELKEVVDYMPTDISLGVAYLGVKWYECAEQVQKVSEKFPNSLITVHGVGEEVEDVWRAYFKRGLIQYCKPEIIFEDFDESKLVKERF